MTVQQIGKRLGNPKVEQPKAQKLAFKDDLTGESVALTRDEFAEAFTKIGYDCGIKTVEDYKGLKFGKLTENVKQGLTKFSRNSNVMFAQSGGIDVQNWTIAWDNVIRQIGSSEDPENVLTRAFPDVSYNAYEIIVPKINQITGTLDQRPIQGNLPQKDNLGYTNYRYSPMFFGSKKIMTEEEIFDRSYGGELDSSGLLQRIGWNMYDLNVKMFSLKHMLISNAIFEGQFNYQGKDISYAIPSANRIALPFGQPWGVETSTGSGIYKANPAAYPLQDIQIIFTQYEIFRRFSGMRKRLVMSPETHTWFQSNPNNQNTVQFALANNDFVNNGQPYDMQQALNYFLISNNDIEIEICYDYYIPDADDQFGNAAKAGTAVYKIPTGQIWVDIEIPETYGAMGNQFAYTRAAQNGGMTQAGPGPWMRVQDMSAGNTAGSIDNPHMLLAAGFNGGPKAARSDYIFTIDVMPTA